MSKKNKPLAATDKEPALDISSMIDVSFLLLIFFLLTSTLDPKETDLGMALPTATTCGPGLPVEVLQIQVQADGGIFVNGITLDTDVNQRNLPLLEDKLKQYKAASDLLSTQPLITVLADDASKGQRFIDVLNTLAKVEIKHFTIGL